jgi:hypothetical protein
MRKKALFFLMFIAFIESIAFANDDFSIKIKYQSKKTNLEERIDLHRRLGTKVLFASLDKWFEFLAPLSESDADNEVFLKDLCKQYLDNPAIAECNLVPRSSVYIPSNKHPCRTVQEIGNDPVVQLQQSVTKALSTLEGPSCNFIEHEVKGHPIKSDIPTLSPFWAQEYIGSRFAKEVVASDLKSGQIFPIPVGIVDEGIFTSFLRQKALDKNSKIVTYQKQPRSIDAFSTHGTFVTNLISGYSPMGVSKAARIQAAYSGSSFEGFQKQAAAFTDLLSQDVKIINVSEVLGQSGHEARTQLTKQGKIIVAATGNNHDPLTRSTFFSSGVVDTGPEVIRVGSINPWGVVSSFSEEVNVTISAPSDHFIKSLADRSYSFGGTSGAVPLVTGALTDALAYLPTLNLEEAKVLLAQTALRTMNSRESPQRNGAGTLNHYKLVRVAKRLKDANFSAQDEKRRLELLHDASLYDFRDELKHMIPEQEELGSDLLNKSNDCEKRRKALDRLLQIFLLTEDNNARSQLVRFYEQEGLPTNAAFYRSFDQEGMIKNLAEMARAKDFGKTPEGVDLNFSIRRAAARALKQILPKGIDVWVALLQSAIPREKVDYERFITFFGNNELEVRTTALKLILDNKGNEVHVDFLVEGLHKFGNLALSILNEIMDRGSVELKRSALIEAAKLLPEGMPLLEKGLSSNDYNTVYYSMRAVEMAGESAAGLILTKLEDEKGAHFKNWFSAAQSLLTKRLKEDTKKAIFNMFQKLVEKGKEANKIADEVEKHLPQNEAILFFRRNWDFFSNAKKVIILEKLNNSELIQDYFNRRLFDELMNSKSSTNLIEKEIALKLAGKFKNTYIKEIEEHLHSSEYRLFKGALVAAEEAKTPELLAILVKAKGKNRNRTKEIEHAISELERSLGQ